MKLIFSRLVDGWGNGIEKILELIEETFVIVCTRCCCTNFSIKGNSSFNVICVESLDFYDYLYAGDVVTTHAKIVNFGKTIVHVLVYVYVENVLTRPGKVGLCNKALLGGSLVNQLGESIPISPSSYYMPESCLCLRNTDVKSNPGTKCSLSFKTGWAMPADQLNRAAEPYTVDYSSSTLHDYAAWYDDCRRLRTSSILNLMNKVASLCARSHCSFDTSLLFITSANYFPKDATVNTRQRIEARARPIYTNSRSLLVEVIALVLKKNNDMVPNSMPTEFSLVATAFYAMSLFPDERMHSMPPLKLQSEDEVVRYQEGRKFFEMHLSRKSKL